MYIYIARIILLKTCHANLMFYHQGTDSSKEK